MIEVEIKVRVTDKQAEALIKGAQKIKQIQFVDAYYDSPDYKLTTNGLWLRQREQQFELKMPATPDGSFHIQRNIPMREITGEQEIRQILGLTAHGTLQEALAAAGYAVLYRFINTRQTYVKDGFTIDFDRADYNELVYCLCEVEMIVDSVEQTEAVLDSLYAFVKQYGISTDRAEGKVGYFIRVTNPAHHQAILQSHKHQA